MNEQEPSLAKVAEDVASAMARVLADSRAELTLEEAGWTLEISQGVARVSGLPSAQLDEVLRFSDGSLGVAFTLDPDEIGVVLLDEEPSLRAGAEVRRTGRSLAAPVGEALLGRVIDAVGRPLDRREPPKVDDWRPIERDAPPIMDRLPVTVPLQTGVKAIDALIPIGRGQRELIIGDRQTGKTAIARDLLLQQRSTGVIGVYCAIGQRSSAVAKLIAELEDADALRRVVVVVAEADDPPGLQFVTPYAATTMAEYFMERGQDAVIIYDDLTRHAQTYRELSLLLRRPPGREAFPGDVFYIHSRLLERATRLSEARGGGSLTALPIVETVAQNLSAYIPTNLISITDGQIYLSPELFHAGALPAVDVGKSVSRVGGKAQLPAYRAVAGDLRLSYAQFRELEAFARFSAQLDAPTKQALDRGRRVREALRQPERDPQRPAAQLATLLAVTSGTFDDAPIHAIERAEAWLRDRLPIAAGDVCQRIEAGEPLSDADRDKLLALAREAVAFVQET